MKRAHMTTPLRKPPRPAIVFLIECFRVRAEAKAQLWAANQITLALSAPTKCRNY